VEVVPDTLASWGLKCVAYYGGMIEQDRVRTQEAFIQRKADVARMSRRSRDGWEPRFGRCRTVQMLAGSKSQKIISAGLDQLTTYGILRDKGAGYLNGLVCYLSDAGLVHTVTNGDYPLMTLTPLGDTVMRGEALFQLV
jgi:ATP-dependent DNA helicase RecQ